MKDFILREWQMSDAASLAENANNINIWNNVRDYFPHPYSEKDGQEFITKVLNGEFGIQRAIVVEGQAVGGIGVFPQKDVERICAEIGYWLGEKYWNRGIMTEAVKQMVNEIFSNYPIYNKIISPVFDFNKASQKVLLNAGFEREAILKQAAIKNDRIVDLYYFSLFRSQWENLSEPRFYKIRRQDRILDDTRAIELLQSAEYGFLSLGKNLNGYAYGVPMSFAYNETDDALYFHCALEGQKLDNLKQNNKVSFCVVGNTKPVSEKFSTLYESVMVFGIAEIIQTEEDKRFALRKLLEKYSPNHLEMGEKYINSSLNRTLTFKLNIEHLSAKAKKT